MLFKCPNNFLFSLIELFTIATCWWWWEKKQRRRETEAKTSACPNYSSFFMHSCQAVPFLCLLVSGFSVLSIEPESQNGKLSQSKWLHKMNTIYIIIIRADYVCHCVRTVRVYAIHVQGNCAAEVKYAMYAIYLRIIEIYLHIYEYIPIYIYSAILAMPGDSVVSPMPPNNVVGYVVIQWMCWHCAKEMNTNK